MIFKVKAVISYKNKGGYEPVDPYADILLEKYLDQLLLKECRGKVKILESGMEGKTAAICGAAALIWEKNR